MAVRCLGILCQADPHEERKNAAIHWQLLPRTTMMAPCSKPSCSFQLRGAFFSQDRPMRVPRVGRPPDRYPLRAMKAANPCLPNETGSWGRPTGWPPPVLYRVPIPEGANPWHPAQGDQSVRRRHGGKMPWQLMSGRPLMKNGKTQRSTGNSSRERP
jgi:hypothetical protein